MLRTLIYLLQIAALVLMTGWLLQQKGQYDVTFGDYRVQGETALLAVVLLVGFFILLMVHRVWLWFVRFPVTWRRYRRDVHLIKGHRALTRSLSALAAGDYKIAHYQAYRAQKLLPDFSAVPTILLATTAEKQGRNGDAQVALEQLLHTEARDLGVRGLVNAALAAGQWEQGLSIARAALLEHPRALMMQRLVYDLECQNGDYQSALVRQKFLIRRKGLSADLAHHHRVLMLTALSRIDMDHDRPSGAYRYARAAFDLDPSFVPAATQLIDYYRGIGKTRAALKVLHRAFRHISHPDLIERHEQMAPQAKNLARRMRYHEKFLNLRPESADVQLLLARVAIAEGMWQEVRAYLGMAEKLEPRHAVYRALADFADRQGDAEASKSYLDQGMAAQPDPYWHCTVTGRRFENWEPLVLPEHYFGTIEWGVPGLKAPSALTSSDLLTFQA